MLAQVAGENTRALGGVAEKGLTETGTFRQTVKTHDASLPPRGAEVLSFLGAARMRNRGGRPRKDGPRQPNGRPREETPDDKARRMHLEALGVDPNDRRVHCIVEARRVAAGANPGDERASTPLGMMASIGLITDDQFRAGELYAKNQIRLGRYKGGPGDTRSHLASLLADSGSPVYRDMGEDSDDFKKQQARCRWVEREITARVWDWRGLENLVVLGETPEFFISPTHRNAAHRLQTLQHDLAEVAKFYDRPPPRDDSRR